MKKTTLIPMLLAACILSPSAIRAQVTSSMVVSSQSSTTTVDSSGVPHTESSSWTKHWCNGVPCSGEEPILDPLQPGNPGNNQGGDNGSGSNQPLPSGGDDGDTLIPGINSSSQNAAEAQSSSSGEGQPVPPSEDGQSAPSGSDNQLLPGDNGEPVPPGGDNGETLIPNVDSSSQNAAEAQSSSSSSSSSGEGQPVPSEDDQSASGEDDEQLLPSGNQLAANQEPEPEGDDEGLLPGDLLGGNLVGGSLIGGETGEGQTSNEDQDEPEPLPQDNSGTVVQNQQAQAEQATPPRSLEGYVVDIHMLAVDSTTQHVSHHYCSSLSEGYTQCVLYDDNTPDARLIGTELVVTEAVFKTLPLEERKLWHSHAFSAKQGLLVLPNMSPEEELAHLRDVIKTYGKIQDLWHPGQDFPYGGPRLGVGVVHPSLWNETSANLLDQVSGVSSTWQERQQLRATLVVPEKIEGADDWLVSGKYTQWDPNTYDIGVPN